MKKVFTILLTFSVLSVFAQDKPFAMKVGDKAPNFMGKDHAGNMVSLKKLTEKGKVVVMFYRGAWCPFCNKYMSQLEQSLPDFKAKNTTVIAITPETDESISKAIDKTKATFSVIYDKDRSIMKNWKVAYSMSDDMKTKYKGYGLDLEKQQGDWMLPVPATYIVGKDGKIEYVHFDENYQKRAEITDILKVL
ncbi:MAG: peroxiredoxin-like family protein [Arcicella sp.]|nr:peroxiredoxin-like family protein [Arcicella sp.]